MSRQPEFGRYEALRRRVNTGLVRTAARARPGEMRRAVSHVVRAGGKRIRPVLVLLACEAAGARAARAIDAAVAVELLHSFTLVHDDIMDHAPTRRGKPTVHALWGVDSGILAGDVILGLAYESLLRNTDAPAEAAGMFTKALLEVCEGQAEDLSLQQRNDVTTRSYFGMIEKKTASLIRLSTILGGLMAGGTPRRVAALGEYGRRLGRAFQVQDDLLDVVAEERSFGKVVGGDILEGKKTYLLVRALTRARGAERRLLLNTTREKQGKAARVRAVTGLYHRLGVIDEAKRTITRETDLARRALRGFPRNRGTEMLRWIAGALETRTF